MTEVVIEICCRIFIVVAVLMLILGICNRWLPVWFCNHFGKWHLEPKKKGYDGCSLNGNCPRCGKFVLMDSQGNWFKV